jgi:hypothetical protein
MMIYYFTVMLNGRGKTPEEAWADAMDALGIYNWEYEEGAPYTTEADDMQVDGEDDDA